LVDERCRGTDIFIREPRLAGAKHMARTPRIESSEETGKDVANQRSQTALKGQISSEIKTAMRVSMNKAREEQLADEDAGKGVGWRKGDHLREERKRI